MMDMGRTPMLGRVSHATPKSSGSPKKVREPVRGKRKLARAHTVVAFRRFLAACFVIILVVAVLTLIARARSWPPIPHHGLHGKHHAPEPILQHQQHVTEIHEHADVREELPIATSSVLSSISLGDGSTAQAIPQHHSQANTGSGVRGAAAQVSKGDSQTSSGPGALTEDDSDNLEEVLQDVPEAQEAANMLHDYKQSTHDFYSDTYDAANPIHIEQLSSEYDSHSYLHDMHDVQAFDAYSDDLMTRGGGGTDHSGHGTEAAGGGTSGHPGATLATATSTRVATGANTGATVEATSGSDLMQKPLEVLSGGDNMLLNASFGAQNSLNSTETRSAVVERGAHPGRSAEDHLKPQDQEQLRKQSEETVPVVFGTEVDPLSFSGVQNMLKLSETVQKQSQKLGQNTSTETWHTESTASGSQQTSHGSGSGSDTGSGDSSDKSSDNGSDNGSDNSSDDGSDSSSGDSSYNSAIDSTVSNNITVSVEDEKPANDADVGDHAGAAAGVSEGATGASEAHRGTEKPDIRHNVESLRGAFADIRRVEEASKDLAFEEEVASYKQLPFLVLEPVAEVATRVLSEGDQAARIQDPEHREAAPDRPKLDVFVGIFTAASRQPMYWERRQAIRDTWLPVLQRLPGVGHAFIVGTPKKDGGILKSIKEEEQEFGESFLVLDAEECYTCLPNKTLTFLLTVTRLYDVEWILKIDDDVFLAAARLPQVLRQWQAVGADYVGCMKTGGVHGNNDDKWYEPLALLISEEYYMHAFGSAYAVHSQVVEKFIAPNHHMLRQTRNEDTTVGLWMQIFNTTFFEDLRMCQSYCSDSSLIVSEYTCTGLCNPPEDQRHLWDVPECSTPPTTAASVQDEDPGTDQTGVEVIQQSEEMKSIHVEQSDLDSLQFVLAPVHWQGHQVFTAMQQALQQQ